jgi:hypothetical protein
MRDLSDLRDMLKDTNILQKIVVLCLIAIVLLFRFFWPIIFLSISGYFILTPNGRAQIIYSIPWQVGLTGVLYLGVVTCFLLVKKIIFRRTEDARLGTYCILVVIAAGISIYFFGLRNYLIARPFESHLSEYTSIHNLSGGSGFSPITGKVIVINKVENNVDLLFSQLPNYLRASNSDEVGTIIWLECSEDVTATYISGAKGYQTSCFVTVIDKATASIIGERIFASAPPPSIKDGPFDYHGEKPTEEIFEFIKSLPTK